MVYAKSFYAGSAHASGPLSGEVIGCYASHDIDEVHHALESCQRCLTEEAWWLGLGTMTVLALMGVVAGLHWLVPVPRRGLPRDTPTLSDEATTTDETPVANAA